MVKQTVHCGARKEVILEERWPLGQRSVRCDDRAAVFVASSDDVVQVEGLVTFELVRA